MFLSGMFSCQPEDGFDLKLNPFRVFLAGGCFGMRYEIRSDFSYYIDTSY
jgi:hypothetical protein